MSVLLHCVAGLTGRLTAARRVLVAAGVPHRWKALRGPQTFGIALVAMLLTAFSVGAIAASASNGHSQLTDAIRPSRSDDDEMAGGLDLLDDDDDVLGGAAGGDSSCVQGDSGSDSNGDGNTDSSGTDGHGGGSGSDSNGDGNTDSSGGGGGSNSSGGGGSHSGGGDSASSGAGDSDSAGDDCPPHATKTATKTPTKTVTKTPTKTSTPTGTPEVHVQPSSTPTRTNTPTATHSPTPTSTGTVVSDVLPTVVVPSPTVDPCKGYAVGDVNGPKAKAFDVRRINSIDAAFILQYDANLINHLNCPENADVNRDGLIDSRDAMLILQYEAGFLTHLPVLPGGIQLSFW